MNGSGVASNQPQPSAPPQLRGAPPGSVATRTSGYAITALVCGALGLSGAGCPLIAPLGIVAIFTGHMAVKEIKGLAPYVDGYGLAVAGLVMGYLSLAVLLFWAAYLILVFFVMFMAITTSPTAVPVVP